MSKKKKRARRPAPEVIEDRIYNLRKEHLFPASQLCEITQGLMAYVQDFSLRRSLPAPISAEQARILNNLEAMSRMINETKLKIDEANLAVGRICEPGDHRLIDLREEPMP